MIPSMASSRTYVGPAYYNSQWPVTGMLLISQWTGHEYKNMEKVFLGVITGTVDEQVIKAVRGVVDFISYARFEVHTEQSLEKMDRAWSAITKTRESSWNLAYVKISTY